MCYNCYMYSIDRILLDLFFITFQNEYKKCYFLNCCIFYNLIFKIEKKIFKVSIFSNLIKKIYQKQAKGAKKHRATILG